MVRAFDGKPLDFDERKSLNFKDCTQPFRGIFYILLIGLSIWNAYKWNLKLLMHQKVVSRKWHVRNM